MLTENIKILRREKGLTQRDLANLLSLSQNTVSNWENGITEPTVTQLQNISEGFGVSLSTLYGIDDSFEKSIWYDYFKDVTLEEFDFLMKELKKYRANKKQNWFPILFFIYYPVLPILSIIPVVHLFVNSEYHYFTKKLT